MTVTEENTHELDDLLDRILAAITQAYGSDKYQPSFEPESDDQGTNNYLLGLPFPKDAVIIRIYYIDSRVRLIRPNKRNLWLEEDSDAFINKVMGYINQLIILSGK